MVSRSPARTPAWYPPAPRRVKILAVFDVNGPEETAPHAVPKSEAARGDWMKAVMTTISETLARWLGS